MALGAGQRLRLGSKREMDMLAKGGGLHGPQYTRTAEYMGIEYIAIRTPFPKSPRWGAETSWRDDDDALLVRDPWPGRCADRTTGRRQWSAIRHHRLFQSAFGGSSRVGGVVGLEGRRLALGRRRDDRSLPFSWARVRTWTTACRRGRQRQRQRQRASATTGIASIVSLKSPPPSSHSSPHYY